MAEMTISSPWITRARAAEIARVSIGTIDNWIKSGRLKAGKPSRGVVRIHVDDLDKAIRGE